MKEYPLTIPNNKGQKLFAVVHQPARTAPYVIFCHGFKGNKLGSFNLHVELARLLCRKGIGSVRFDFAGSGDSEGKFEDLSLKQELADLESVYGWLVRQRFADKKRIAMLGHSMGGTITIMFAAGIPVPAVLLAPSVDRRDSMRRYEQRGSIRRLGKYITISGWKLNSRFLTEGAVELFSTANKLKAPVLLVQGTADESCSYENSMKFFGMLACTKKFIALPGADHNFSNIKDRERILKTVSSWLGKSFSP